MTEPATFSKDAMVGLLTKLDALDLKPEERDLLRAILTVARDVTEVVVSDPKGPANFSDEFANAFTASKVELVMAYAAAPHSSPSHITRSSPAHITRSSPDHITRSSPAHITR
jgi:hypothetical protein